jgi:hypothetical protein
MFTGTMIDDLIQTVARAEEQAQTPPLVRMASPPAQPLQARDYSRDQELLGVA